MARRWLRTFLLRGREPQVGDGSHGLSTEPAQGLEVDLVPGRGRRNGSERGAQAEFLTVYFLHEWCRHPRRFPVAPVVVRPEALAGHTEFRGKPSFATHADRLRPRLEGERLPIAGPAARRSARRGRRPGEPLPRPRLRRATTGRDSTTACAPCARATCSSSGSSTASAATSPTWSTARRASRWPESLESSRRFQRLTLPCAGKRRALSRSRRRFVTIDTETLDAARAGGGEQG